MAQKPSKSFIFLVFSLISPIFPAPAAAKIDTLSIYWENDGTLVKPNHRTDRHYTNGAKFVYTYDPNYLWLKDLAQFNDFAKGRPTRTRLGYFLGQNIYTPDEVDNPAARDPKDRVFAGWLYGGIFAQRAAGSEMEHFEVSVGVIGPSSHGRETQEFVHKVVGAEKPIGWDAQLEDEFAVDFTWNKRQVLDTTAVAPSDTFDCIVEYGFTAGSVHRNANIGLITRYGFNIPADFGPTRLDMPANFPAETEDEHSFYLFARAAARFVECDRFLTGLDEKPLTGHFQFGAVYRYKSLEVSYSQTFMTKDYNEQPSEDSFAAISVTYYF